jgi:Phosphotransferase enzyme family
VLEDLSDAVWPPPWSPELVDGVLATLEQVAAARPPAGLPRLETLREVLASGWRTIAHDAAPFLSIGLCSRDWLGRVLPALIAASDAAVLEGDALVHVDVRSDNLCVRGGRTILVDWNQAAVGNPLFDVVEWLPSLALEGGPSPGQILAPPEGVELASLLAGFWACRAGLPPPPTAPLVRELQRGQVEVLLPWLAESLVLPPPDGSALRSRG